MMRGNTKSFVLCDIGQDLQINFCNLLYLYFYIIFVILGLGNLFLFFKVHLMHFRSNLVHVMIRY